MYNIILYHCKKHLRNGLQKYLITERQKIEIIEDEKELIDFCNKTKYGVVVCDVNRRSDVIALFQKITNPNLRLLFLISNRESKKQNYKNKNNDRILYFSMPSSQQELSYLLNIIFEMERMSYVISEYEKILEAYEHASEFSRQELMDAHTNIKAHEKVTELSRKELMAVKESLAAWEKVSDYSRKEIIDLNKEKEAYISLLEYSKEQEVFKEELLKAWEKVMEMGRQELIKAYDELKGHLKK